MGQAQSAAGRHLPVPTTGGRPQGIVIGVTWQSIRISRFEGLEVLELADQRTVPDLGRAKSASKVLAAALVQISGLRSIGPDALRIDHAASTAFQIAGAVLACFGNLPRLNWFLRMRWSSSMPAIVTLARRNLLKPSIGPILAFTPRWSCSMMLLRYFDDLSLVSFQSPFSSGNSRTARWEAA